MKHKVLMIAIAVTLLFLPSANAALISIQGPTVVNPADGPFTFDVLLLDTTGLNDLDFWGLGLALSPETDATFIGTENMALNQDYVFYGNSYDYQAVLEGPYRIQIGDATDSEAVEDYAGKLLATVEVDIGGTTVGELYSVGLYGLGTWTIFGDSSFNMDTVVALDSPYEFTTAPIPAAAWLLGSGLLGLVAIRRRK